MQVSLNQEYMTLGNLYTVSLLQSSRRVSLRGQEEAMSVASVHWSPQRLADEGKIDTDRLIESNCRSDDILNDM